VTILFDIANIIAPLFLIAGIGFFWSRSGQNFDTNMIGALVVNFGVPCLIFSSLTKLHVEPAIFAEMAGIYCIAVALMAAVGAAALKLMRLDIKAFLPSLTFGNNGNMGLPLCLFAFGEPGLVLGIGVLVVAAITNFAIGTALVSGRFRPGEIARTPHLYVVAVALIFLIAGIDPPKWLANTTSIIGGFSIPLMLMALGVSLSRLRVADIKRALALSLVRLGAGFAVGVTLAWALDLEGPIRGVLILQCAMPTAVLNYILAVRYNRSEEAVAGVIVASTVISFAMLPLLIWYILPS
jgi:malate permease and related proteins